MCESEAGEEHAEQGESSRAEQRGAGEQTGMEERRGGVGGGARLPALSVFFV